MIALRKCKEPRFHASEIRSNGHSIYGPFATIAQRHTSRCFSELYQAVACVRFSWTNQWLADTDCYFFAHIDLAPFSLEKRE
ncbi:hypothetical protein CDAR_371691 [Caerostris darwini]|uniref:Uncharacterized protein n=1 Tax=Caerostris darwini TaxID=1538125 RepID=A0AAV4X8S0_9ARAC|nr:hypothetical protein CDAR_371691 [Caerostris darwini]